MNITKKEMIKWLLKYHSSRIYKTNNLFWNGVTYTSKEEVVEAIKSEFSKMSKTRLYEDEYRQFVC